MASRYAAFDLPVTGGSLRVGQWGDRGPVVVGAHGITANHLSWVAVGEELGRDVRLLAPDLRGRGGSASLPGPFGMAAHARDVIAVLDAAGVERGVLVGHSMGGFVAAVAAAEYPDRVAGVVFVDGGLPLPAPPGLDLDALLQAVIGPAMARLAMTFPTREAYRAFWGAHPALADWDERVWTYLDYDLVGEEPELRSSVSVDAVRADAADTLRGDTVASALARSAAPTALVRAERGMLDGDPLYPDALTAPWPGVQATPAVPGTNHYTIVFRPAGVDAIASRVRDFCAPLR